MKTNFFMHIFFRNTHIIKQEKARSLVLGRQTDRQHIFVCKIKHQNFVFFCYTSSLLICLPSHSNPKKPKTFLIGACVCVFVFLHWRALTYYHQNKFLYIFMRFSSSFTYRKRSRSRIWRGRH